ncbi:MAG: biopolymer transporter ExbD [Gammaproteobacteria bacterium]|nr:biopolymer transporter ExbD [Gammaproteobacteria bacterium]
MGFERRRRAGSILNLTPLIDIVFLLLVFFMLTSHFIEDEAIDIDLPAAKSGNEATGKEFVEVIVNPDGELLIDGRTIDLEHLEQTLRGALHAPETRFVRLRGDHEVRLGLAVSVIDAARSAGAEALDILTRQP